MSWAKIDDQLHNHPKFGEAGLEATGLWTLGMSWSAAYLTDGLIPDYQLPRLGATDSAVRKLVAVGLWDKVEGGYQIHDYLDYNPPAEKVKEERKAARERMRELRARREDDTDERLHERSENVQRSSVTPSPSPSPSPSPVPDQNCANAQREKKPRQPTKPRPEAVNVFREAAHRFPAKAWWADVDEIVGCDPPELERWRETVKAWVGLGWNPTNVKGMLEVYQRGETPGERGQTEPKGFAAIREFVSNTQR